MLSGTFKDLRQGKFKKSLGRILTGIQLRLLKKVLMRVSPYTFYRWISHPVSDYRENEEAILEGKVPERYTRLASLIPGSRILEIGAGEGVLALLLAQKKEKVFAIDISPFRHKKALELQRVWHEKGFAVDRCEMILGSFKDNLDLLKNVDTVVAVSSIYYFRDDIQRIFEAIAKHAAYVVLAGNAKRGQEYFTFGERSVDIGRHNYYASIEGMESILKQNGYKIIKRIDQTIEQGNQPVVVGFKQQQ